MTFGFRVHYHAATDTDELRTYIHSAVSAAPLRIVASSLLLVCARIKCVLFSRECDGDKKKTQVLIVTSLEQFFVSARPKLYLMLCELCFRRNGCLVFTWLVMVMELK